MDLLQMRYVTTIARIGNMTKAAQVLHVSQSALSLSYKRLEEDVQSKSKDDLERWVAGCIECGYFEKSVKVKFAVDVLHHSVHGVLINTLDDESLSSEHVSLMSFSLLVFIRGLCTIEGQKIIDGCTERYFK